MFKKNIININTQNMFFKAFPPSICLYSTSHSSFPSLYEKILLHLKVSHVNGAAHVRIVLSIYKCIPKTMSNKGEGGCATF